MKKYLLALIASLMLFIGTNAFAVGPDFSTITSSVDFSTVVTGVMAVAVALVGVYIAVRGARMLLSFVRG